MAPKTKTPSSSQIEELREKFNAKYAASPPTEPFHPKDIDRIRNGNLLLQRFLEQYDLDIEMSLSKLWETCIWRQSYGTNDLTDEDVNQKYLREGSIYVHSQDIDGKPLLIFRVKLHSKSNNMDELIRVVIYWIERAQRENHLTQLSLVFDMAGTGLAQMDVEFVRRIVETFKQYYPNALNYILVYELAWILNAAFKIIKSFLPPKAVEVLKMVTKKDVTQYVPIDKCPVMWGGKDNYEFQFVQEAKSVTTKALAANAGDDDQPHQDMAFDKKVHFANSVPLAVNKSSAYDMGMLRLEPKEYVNICPETGEAKLKLTNTSKEPLAFKIQTTSPEKFRVRPRCGVVLPNETAEVSILLKSDQQLSNDTKDKFLVMAVHSPTGDCTTQEITELWQQKDPNDPEVENHRLVCRLDERKDCASKSEYNTGKNAESNERLEKLECRVKCIKNLQFAQIGVLALVFIGVCFLMYQQMRSGTAGSCGSKKAAMQCKK